MRSIEDPVKVVDGTYKNLLEVLTPGLRQCVSTGKLYVKALQNATAAGRGYMDAVVHLSDIANSSSRRDIEDLGAALKQLVQMQNELAIEQGQIVMSLDVDFLTPLDANSEKDAKQLVRDQKQFHQDYKKFSEAHAKAVATLTKSKKKNRSHSDMYLRNTEDSERRLTDFIEDSVTEVELQERIRYEFILEKHWTLARQCLEFYKMGQELIESHLGKWKDVLERSRGPHESPLERMEDVDEREPSDNGCYDGMLDNYSNDRMGSSPSLRSSDQEAPLYAKPLPRSKLDFGLIPTTAKENERLNRMTECNGTQVLSLVRVLYPFAASGEHQMSLQEGDMLTVYTKKKDGGWMFGENNSTKRSGWFPVSYTEPIPEEIPPTAGFVPTVQSVQIGRDSLRPHNTGRNSIASLRSRQSLSQSYDSLPGNTNNRRRPYRTNSPRIPTPTSSSPSTPEMQRSRDSGPPPGNRYRGDGEPSAYPR